MKKLEILQELAKRDTETQSEKNGADRLAQGSVATNLQSVKGNIHKAQ